MGHTADSSAEFDFSEVDVKELIRIFDPPGDFIDSISTVSPSYRESFIDILFDLAERGLLTSYDVENRTRFNKSTAYCGTASAELTTVCPANVQPMPAGEYYEFTMEMAGAVPLADSGHSFIYSLVLDSDDRVENNWKFVPPFDYDLFQGADRWYQLKWNHLLKKWSVDVTQVNDQQKTTVVPSTVRASISGKTITFFVSASEVPAPKPGYRLTAFGHDGKFSQTDRGADVSGANPQEPLTRVP
jgi:hypothetical protein